MGLVLAALPGWLLSSIFYVPIGRLALPLAFLALSAALLWGGADLPAVLPRSRARFLPLGGLPRRLPLLPVDPLDVRRDPPDGKADGLRRPLGPHDDRAPPLPRSVALRRAVSLLSLRDVPLRAAGPRGPRPVGVRLQPDRGAPAGPRGARGLRRDPRAARRPGDRGLRRPPPRPRRDVRRRAAVPLGQAPRRPRLVDVVAPRRQPAHDHRVAALHVPPRRSPSARGHVPVPRDAPRPRGPHLARGRDRARQPAPRGRPLGEPVGPPRVAPRPRRRKPRRARLQARVPPQPRDARFPPRSFSCRSRSPRAPRSTASRGGRKGRAPRTRSFTSASSP